MSKTLAVFGATGVQGRSVIDHVLNDSELSQKYKIRAIVRDTSSSKLEDLKEKIEIVQGDMLDRKSLETALAGVDTVYSMTKGTFGPDHYDVEYNSAINVADIAASKGASYLIFSTLPAVREISSGKYAKVVSFDAKADAEKYIRQLPIKSAFFAIGGYMENFRAQHVFWPKEQEDGTWVIAQHASGKTKMPLLDATRDAGKFVGAILADPEKYEGKTLCGAEGLYSWDEITAIMSKTTGKKVVYKQIPLEEFRKSIPYGADFFLEGLSFQEEFGYYGPGTEEKVKWSAANARGQLRGLEEYLEEHPLPLGPAAGN